MRRAVLSVSDKTGLVPFGRDLVARGFELVSTGGTAKTLADAGVPVTNVSDVTGFPEMMEGRVKTLHPMIHGGIIARRRNLDDLAVAAKHGIGLVDLVVVNLYPFVETAARPNLPVDDLIEQIDIGGPSLVRAAAKSFRDVIVVVSPEDYGLVIASLDTEEDMPLDVRLGLALKAFDHTADYDGAIAATMQEFQAVNTELTRDSVFLPETIRLTMRKWRELAYGENGWQTPACHYSTGSNDPLALDKFKLVAGTAPSYNNLCDLDRLLQTITHLAAAYEVNCGDVPHMAVGAKHGNPCGAAVGTPEKVLKQMVIGDSRALFGGLPIANFPLDEALVEILLTYVQPTGTRRLLDGVIVPDVTEGALEMLRRKGDKCRIFVNPALANLGVSSLDYQRRLRYVRGGFLAQPNYTFIVDLSSPEIEKIGEMTPEQGGSMLVAWAVGSTSNSNTITLANDHRIIGNGVGQQDRVGAAELALKRATDAGSKQLIRGAVAYSDSFFPFPDAVAVLAKAGVAAILTSSGSVNDALTKEVCAEYGVALRLIPDKIGRGFFGH